MLNFKKYFANTSWLFFERIIRLGIGLFVGIYVARYLGVDSFGLLNFSISFVGLFIALPSLGLDNLVVQAIVKTPDIRDKILGTAMILKLIGGGISYLLILIVLPFINSPDAIPLILIIAAAFFFQSLNVIDFFFQAKVKAKYVAIVQVLQTFVVTGSRIILVLMDADLIWFAFMYLLDAIVLASGLIYMYSQKVSGIFNWFWSSELAKKLLLNSWPLMLSIFVITVYMKVDQVMIQNYLGSSSVGIYAAATKISEASYFIPSIITLSLFPAILNAKSTSKYIYLQRLKQLYSLMFYLALLIAIPITFFSKEIMLVLYGSAFLGSEVILEIHILGIFFVFWGVAFGQWILAENLQHKQFYCHVIGMLVNIFLNILLIPMYGIIGAAWATIVSLFIANMLFPLVLGKRFRAQIMMQFSSIFDIKLLFKSKKK